jgi:hypothetical protein
MPKEPGCGLKLSSLAQKFRTQVPFSQWLNGSGQSLLW